MARVEILVEEQSMECCLREILPKIVSENWTLDENYFIRSHQGKSDLRKSIPTKIRTFSHWWEPVAVIILHDQDSADCVTLKKDLIELCGDCNVPILVRVVCRELESWYLGDLRAVESAYAKFRSENYLRRAQFRNPDQLGAKDYLRIILPEYQPLYSSKVIAKYMNIECNNSESFRQFVLGVRRIFSQMEHK